MKTLLIRSFLKVFDLQVLMLMNGVDLLKDFLHEMLEKVGKKT